MKEVYIGHTVQGMKINNTVKILNTHEAIISEEVYFKIQKEYETYLLLRPDPCIIDDSRVLSPFRNRFRGIWWMVLYSKRDNERIDTMVAIREYGSGTVIFYEPILFYFSLFFTNIS